MPRSHTSAAFRSSPDRMHPRRPGRGSAPGGGRPREVCIEHRGSRGRSPLRMSASANSARTLSSSEERGAARGRLVGGGVGAGVISGFSSSNRCRRLPIEQRDARPRLDRERLTRVEGERLLECGPGVGCCRAIEQREAEQRVPTRGGRHQAHVAAQHVCRIRRPSQLDVADAKGVQPPVPNRGASGARLRTPPAASANRPACSAASAPARRSSTRCRAAAIVVPSTSAAMTMAASVGSRWHIERNVRLACADVTVVDTGEVRALRSEAESSLELDDPPARIRQSPARSRDSQSACWEC